MQILNLQEVLVKYTVTDENIKRRKSWAATKDAIAVAMRAHKLEIARLSDICIIIVVRLILFLMPVKLAEFIYDTKLRN